MNQKLNPGDACPDFVLKDQDGTTRKHSDYAGSPLMIYFYPKAMTPGCTTQSCAVRDAQETLQGLSCASLGISPDSPDKLKKFQEKYDLDFPLLSDEDHQIAEAFGVWGEKSMYGKKYWGIIRSAFLISGEGKILQSWYKVKPGDTVPKVLAALESLT